MIDPIDQALARENDLIEEAEALQWQLEQEELRISALILGEHIVKISNDENAHISEFIENVSISCLFYSAFLQGEKESLFNDQRERFDLWITELAHKSIAHHQAGEVSL
jgi:hypothetical protein